MLAVSGQQSAVSAASRARLAVFLLFVDGFICLIYRLLFGVWLFCVLFGGEIMTFGLGFWNFNHFVIIFGWVLVSFCLSVG